MPSTKTFDHLSAAARCDPVRAARRSPEPEPAAPAAWGQGRTRPSDTQSPQVTGLGTPRFAEVADDLLTGSLATGGVTQL